MTFIVWIHSLALLLLNLSLIAWARIRFPDSHVGSVLNTIMG